VPVTDDYANQFDCLIDGLSDPKDNAKIAAFSELVLLTCKRPDKRAELFRTTGKDLKESAWYRIMTQCLNVINELKTKIDIEYNGVQAGKYHLKTKHQIILLTPMFFLSCSSCSCC
jgi:flagellar motor switch protein FliM